ncbi:hypothetical protein Q5752_001169 [Cryptotrichosporon argae]
MDEPTPEQRTAPIYDRITDAYGNSVIDKPANRTMIAQQKARIARAELAADSSAARGPRAGRFAKPAAPAPSSWLRPVLLLTLFLPLLSHFLTSSYSFNLYAPARAAFRRSPLNPFRPRLRVVGPDELAAHDGRDGAPVWLAVDGDVYDVSANRRIYGKGGGYNMMAGRDASRAFITGCFQTHLTHDLRGLSADQLKALEHWKSFFSNHEKYTKIGTVLLPPIDPASPIPPPCRPDAAPGADATGGARPAHAGQS